MDLGQSGWEAMYGEIFLSAADVIRHQLMVEDLGDRPLPFAICSARRTARTGSDAGSESRNPTWPISNGPVVHRGAHQTSCLSSVQSAASIEDAVLIPARLCYSRVLPTPTFLTM